MNFWIIFSLGIRLAAFRFSKKILLTNCVYDLQAANDEQRTANNEQLLFKKNCFPIVCTPRLAA